MDENLIERKKFEVLDKEYQVYIQKLKWDWTNKNNPPSFQHVYEILRPEEHAQIDQYRADWANYVTPFAEAWWKERGYGIIWPEDNSKLTQIYKLETVDVDTKEVVE